MPRQPLALTKKSSRRFGAPTRSVDLISPLLIAALLAPPTIDAKLPAHATAPGEGRFAVAGGLDGDDPAGAIYLGLASAVTLIFHGVWSADAPLIGGTLQIAAGRARESIYAHAWIHGDVRPALTSAVDDTFSGAQIAAGLGATWWPAPFSLLIEGGFALGLPIVPFDGDIVGSDIDQRHGVFAVQRLQLAVDLGDHVQLGGWSALEVPLSALEVERPEEDLATVWRMRLGGHLALRW